MMGHYSTRKNFISPKYFSKFSKEAVHITSAFSDNAFTDAAAAGSGHNSEPGTGTVE